MFRLIILLLNAMVSPIVLAMGHYEVAVALDILFDASYVFIGLSSFLFYESQNEGSVANYYSIRI